MTRQHPAKRMGGWDWGFTGHAGCHIASSDYRVGVIVDVVVVEGGAGMSVSL